MSWLILPGLVLFFLSLELMCWLDRRDHDEKMDAFFKRQDAERDRQMSAGPEKECPECATVVPSRARVCSSCQHPFWWAR